MNGSKTICWLSWKARQVFTFLPSLFNFKEESNMPKGYMSKMGKPFKKKKKKKK